MHKQVQPNVTRTDVVALVSELRLRRQQVDPVAVFQFTPRTSRSELRVLRQQLRPR